jgi:ABC-2 type transport system permease protein
MHRIWTITALRLKEFFKSPGALVLMFVMPIVFSSIFGGISENASKTKPTVNVVYSHSAVNDKVFKLLKKNNHFVWEKTGLADAKKNVAAEDALAAVVIPGDLSERINETKPVFDVILQRKSENYYALLPHLNGTASLIARSFALGGDAYPQALETLITNKSVSVEQQVIQKDTKQKADVNLMFVGFAIMFMMFGLSGTASAILEERIGGTWGRLMVTPASKLQITLGYLLAYFLMGWIQFAVLMAAMRLMFGADWGNLVYLIPFASLVILCVVGFGLMIAGMVKTKQQASAISAVLIVSTCMLGGVYWSIDLVPDIMQKIAMGVPQSWAMAGFKEIFSGSLHAATLAKDALALAGFTILFFFIGLKGIKFE